MNDTLILHQPATRWEDALPVGGGLTGAAVYGSIHQETILLNRQDVWLPLWPRPTVPDMAAHLPEYRRLLESGRYEEADRFWKAKLAEQGWPEVFYTNPFCAGFDLRLEQEVEGAFESYSRRLDMRQGIASVQWSVPGVGEFSRELFVSRADDLVVLRVRGPRGQVGVKAAFDQHPLMEDNRKTNHYARAYEPEEIPLRTATRAEGGWLTLDGRFTEKMLTGSDRPTGKGFGAVAKVIARGRVAKMGSCEVCWHNGKVVSVRNADEVLIVARVFNGCAKPQAVRDARAAIERAPRSYESLLKRHISQHRRLYQRLEFKIAERAEVTNETLLEAAYQDRVDNALTERMFKFGRHLMISSTHPTGRPPNLQGIWNGDYVPAWSSDYTLDENIQMMHWAVMPGNLPELMEPYFALLESTIRDWQTNARRFFGCRGIYAPLRQSDHGLLPEMMPYLIWFAGAGWLAQPFHDYYLFTGDRKFLRDRAVPFLKQVALFYEDFLYEGKDGKLTICPSMSPENTPHMPGATTIAINPTMDVAVCREVLGNLSAACELLGIERAGVRRWRAMLAKLPAYEVNQDGAMREWLRPELKDNYHHRHQSHVYPLFPGSEITRETSPRLFEACRVAVEKRLVIGIKSQTGWSLAHMANIYARLEEGDKALQCLDLLARACTGVNLWTYHNDWRKQGVTMDTGKLPPFQMDANLGLTAAVLEMLAFSVCSDAARSAAERRSPEVLIKLLPALPSRWERGSVRGILCRGGVELDMQWDLAKRELTATLTSPREQTVTIKAPCWSKDISPRGSKRTSPDSQEKDYFTLTLPAGRPVKLSAC